MTTGRDPMTPVGFYVDRTLLSQFETQSGQRRVVMVGFVHNFILEMLLHVASVIIVNNEVRSPTDRSSSCHVFLNSKLTGQATDEGKSS